MALTIVLHIQNSEAIMGEIDEAPSPDDTLIIVKNPRRGDGKDLTFLAENTTTVIWPIDRINFIEILSGGDDEEIIGFVRE